ncbi:MAG: phosphatidylglycerophosphatase A [Endomicrobium sp.]|nr:phosphatidylglycerophosphatase A [Endomicrobium sp.]
MKNSIHKIILCVSSCFYLGYIKYAPGTFTSLIILFLWIFLVPYNYILHICILGLIYILSVMFSFSAEKIYNKHDDQRIVIDEIAGMCFSFAFVPKNCVLLILGFILFRIIDIKKPCFISQVQSLSGGFGVTMDDVLSGIFVNIILQVLAMVTIK